MTAPQLALLAAALALGEAWDVEALLLPHARELQRRLREATPGGGAAAPRAAGGYVSVSASRRVFGFGDGSDKALEEAELALVRAAAAAARRS
jgi:hypothetical protein